jgi:AraC-like DNA-binding protein
VRAARAMGGCDISRELERPHVLGGAGNHGQPSPLFALFRYIDRVLLEDRYLAGGLALDEQVVRLVAIDIARKAQPSRLTSRQTARGGSASVLDGLVDFITSNRGGSITLTDLEEQSHYSRRQLQNLFQERFGCTPMQFVRRQRLAAAMEQLQAPEDDSTVSRIARDCGYRNISNFSSDFQRQFGVQPSMVLRRSRVEQARSRSRR